MRDLLGFLLGLLTSLGLPGLATAQKIESTSWGFDGTSVAPGFFNPLTVVVRNDTAAPIDDVLALVESNGLTALGAPIAERCYLTPGATRTLQFHAFHTSSDSAWVLRWRSAVASIQVPQPQVGWRSLVILRDGDGVPDTRYRLPAFPAAWFPATPGASEALAEAILDFAPEWDETRAQAFLAWVRDGGRLHLFERNGTPPQFDGALAVLNDPRRVFRVGAGTVVRYAKPLDDQLLTRVQRALRYPDEATPPRAARAPNILSDLQTSLLPHHPWGLIFTAAVVFLACVGPVHWILARRRVDWRLSILYLLTVVTLFTLLFAWLGARGYDEVSRLRTLAYARVCGDGEVIATQYTNAFVTGGGERRFQPRAAASLTSTAQMYEAVPGVIDNGTGGSLAVDMPMFSARGFVHRGRYEVSAIPAVRYEAGPDRPGVTVAGGTPLGGYLLDDGRLFRLEMKGDRLNVSTMLTNNEVAYMQRVNDAKFDATSALALALDSVCERLQLPSADQLYPDRRTRRALILFASPPELRVDVAPPLGDEQGYVLYDYELR